jgi:hypothetical protein
VVRRRLDLSGLEHHLTDAEVNWVANAPNLVELGLDGARVHDQLVYAIIQLPALRQLRLAGAPISVTATFLIGTTANLVEVDLADTVADDATAAALLTLPRLKILRLDHTPITDRGLVGPIHAPLTELYMSHTAITDVGTRQLDLWPRLEALGLGDTKVSDQTLWRWPRSRPGRGCARSRWSGWMSVIRRCPRSRAEAHSQLSTCRQPRSSIHRRSRWRPGSVSWGFPRPICPSKVWLRLDRSRPVGSRSCADLRHPITAPFHSTTSSGVWYGR